MAGTRPHRPEGPIRDVLLAGLIGGGTVAYSFHLNSFPEAKLAFLCLGLIPWYTWAYVSRTRMTGALPTFLPIALWLATSTGFALLGSAQVPAYTLRAALFIAVPLLACLPLGEMASTECGRRRLEALLIASAFAAGVLGLLQYCGLMDFLLPPIEGYHQAMYSVFGNQDLFGGYMALGMALTMSRVSRRIASGAWTGAAWLECAALAVLLPALLLSGTRSAWLAGIAGSAVAVWPNMRRAGRAPAADAQGSAAGRVGPLAQPMTRRAGTVTGMTALLLAAGLIAYLNPDATLDRAASAFRLDDTGIRVRLWIWDAAIRLFTGFPVLGVGLGNFEYWSPAYMGEAYRASGGWHIHNALHAVHAHSDVLEVLCETGLLGLCFAGWMAARLARCRGPEWGGLAALIVFGFFNTSVYSPPHLLAGLILILCLHLRSNPSPWMNTPAMWKQGLRVAGPALAVALAAVTLWTVVWPGYWLRTGQDLHIEGKNPLPYYRRAIEFPVTRYKAAEGAAYYLSQQQDQQRAIGMCDVAAGGIDTGELHLEWGALLYELGRMPEARKQLDAARQRWPWHMDAWRLLVRITPPGALPSLVEAARETLNPEQIERLKAEQRP